MPLTLLAAPPSTPARVQLPADVPVAGVLELTTQGEVALLPMHDEQPFNAILITRSATPCAHVAHDMMDVESWTKRWNIKEVVVRERTSTRVRYEMNLDMAFSPRIPGLIERPDAHRVVFNDVQTGAQFIWTLEPLPADASGEGTLAGCALRYSLLEAPGKASGWVGIIKAIEPSAVDAANFAAALSSARGFVGAAPTRTARSAEAEAAFARLARHGTALRTLRNASAPSIVVVRRVVDRPPSDVAWSVRDKKRYPERVRVIGSVKDRGRTAEYSIGAFGGRVAFAMSVEESGDLQAPDGLTIQETVTGGDIQHGRWVWRLRPVPGGTDVELTFNADLVEGSAVLRTLARADPIARESLGLHMALSFMGKLVGGKPLGAAALARAP